MARTYLVFGDIEGKLEVLRVECTRCPRKGRYSVAKLIEKYGRKANMMKWREQLNGDCPRRAEQVVMSSALPAAAVSCAHKCRGYQEQSLGALQGGECNSLRGRGIGNSDARSSRVARVARCS